MNPALERVLSKLGEWWDGFWIMLPNLMVALVVMVGFYMLGRVLRRVVRQLLRRTKLSRTTIPTLAKVASFAVSLIGLIVALHVLHLEEAAASLLAGAGVVGLAIGLAFQDVAANYFAGLLLSVKHPFEVGDLLETNGVTGTVERIELRTTSLRTFEGQIVSIPNRKVFQEAMKNFSVKRRRRVDVAVGVSYDADLEHVEKVAREALEGVDGRLEQEPVQVLYTGFGGSSVDLVARVWVKFEQQSDFLNARHSMIKAIKRAFDRESISIPFPIRTLDFGIEGGEKLSAMFPERMSHKPREKSGGGEAASRAN